MANKKVGVVVGSLRKDSYNKKVAEVLKTLAPASLEFEDLEIGNLEIYNQDFDEEGNTPSSWTAFREKVKKCDAYLFLTPEYNRSVPAAIKNALDVASRPYGQNAWNGKPGAVVSVSIGAIGGFGANHHLRQTLVFLNIPIMPQPEAYIGNAMQLFDERGKLVSDDTEGYLKGFMESFANWVEANSPKN